MKAYTYIEKGKFALIDKPKPELQEATDAIDCRCRTYGHLHVDLCDAEAPEAHHRV